MTTTPDNPMPTLDELDSMPIAAVATLPVEALAQLAEDLAALVEHSRRLQAILAAALTLRSGRGTLQVVGGRDAGKPAP